MSAAGVDPSLTATGVSRADGGLITLPSTHLTALTSVRRSREDT